MVIRIENLTKIDSNKEQNLGFLKCKLRSYEDDVKFKQARFKYSFTVSSVGKLR